jgi:DNA helicase II / ATP-dependent DNA helicase PcrA
VSAGGPVPATRYGPAQLARLLGMAEPTTEQAAVIGAPFGPMAVIAGAGSGKSETMAARLVWLVANGMVRPERVLGLTFTRKAAAELAERVRSRLDGLRRAGLEPPGAGTSGDWLDGDPVIATYHAYAGRLVADHALREAVEPSLRLITPAVAWQLASRVVAAYDGPVDAITWAPSTVTAAVLDLSAELADHLREPADVVEVGEWLAGERDERSGGSREDQRGQDGRHDSGGCPGGNGRPGKVPAPVQKILDCQRVREQLLPLVAAYAAAKAAREVMDYGDQLALAARIADRHPEVGAAERARYQVVLLDEYQDTSHAQLVLLRALFDGGHPVTAVGDPCQSIYGWRGASAGNLLRFGADFPVRGKPAPTALLSTSFRNTGRVLDAAAALQEGLRAAAPGLPRPEPPRPELPRLVPPPSRAARGAVVCALLETAAAEAGWVADQIAGLLSLPPGVAPDRAAWPDGRPDRLHASEIGVLCRKRTQFPALRAALEATGIPVEVVGLGGLLTVPEVQDVVATLRVMHDPTAADALARLLTSPRWRIGPRDLVALGRRSRWLARAAELPARRDRPHDGAQGARAAGRPETRGEPRHEPGHARLPGRESQGGAGLTVPDPDVMEQAVTDLTADPGSLIEALDDLGEPSAYSATGYARLAALAAELRSLRGHAGRPLHELVGEVERTLGLDIEVASRPGADPASSRADLDAFADAAAAFAGDQEEPTLGAFLAYLAAAETEEFGLEGGRVGDTDSVKLATVHAAKGLQWAAVFVPGLSEGAHGHIFPARPKMTTRWTENPRLLPFGLRGDAADLPLLGGLDPEALSSFADACADRELAEERRLAYVATTRAAFWLGCTGYWWGNGVSRLGPSVFLDEVRAACEAGAGTVAAWAQAPAEDAANPALAEPATASWPATASGARYEAVREAGALVAEAMAAAAGGPASGPDRAEHAPGPDQREQAPQPEQPPRPDRAPRLDQAEQAAGPDAAEPAAKLGPEDLALIAAWERDTDLLLAERAQWRSAEAVTVALPRRLPVSSLVTMATDPGRLAQQVRRPMPRPPAPLAHRGTEFHRWLEQRFGPQRLIDPGDLFGAADSGAEPGSGEDLAALRERFEAGEWSGRWPCEVEVPFETLIGGRLIRGRIDAVFADAPGGGFDVVDWKTGRQPGSADEERAVAVQLAAYRLAWAALAGVPVEQVRAAFYHVADAVTVRPADLLDEAGLAALIEAIPVR